MRMCLIAGIIILILIIVIPAGMLSSPSSGSDGTNLATTSCRYPQIIPRSHEHPPLRLMVFTTTTDTKPRSRSSYDYDHRMMMGGLG